MRVGSRPWRFGVLRRCGTRTINAWQKMRDLKVRPERVSAVEY